MPAAGGGNAGWCGACTVWAAPAPLAPGALVHYCRLPPQPRPPTRPPTAHPIPVVRSISCARRPCTSMSTRRAAAAAARACWRRARARLHMKTRVGGRAGGAWHAGGMQAALGARVGYKQVPAGCWVAGRASPEPCLPCPSLRVNKKQTKTSLLTQLPTQMRTCLAPTKRRSPSRRQRSPRPRQRRRRRRRGRRRRPLPPRRQHRMRQTIAGGWRAGGAGCAGGACHVCGVPGCAAAASICLAAMATPCIAAGRSRSCGGSSASAGR